MFEGNILYFFLTKHHQSYNFSTFKYYWVANSNYNTLERIARLICHNLYYLRIYFPGFLNYYLSADLVFVKLRGYLIFVKSSVFLLL